MTRAQREKLDELLDLEEGLTDWEASFLESLEQQRRAALCTEAFVMTDRQAAKLEAIHAERCG